MSECSKSLWSSARSAARQEGTVETKIESGHLVCLVAYHRIDRRVYERKRIDVHQSAPRRCHQSSKQNCGQQCSIIDPYVQLFECFTSVVPSFRFPGASSGCRMSAVFLAVASIWLRGLASEPHRRGVRSTPSPIRRSAR